MPPKTGTTSLGLAYKRLGLKAEGYRKDLKEILNKDKEKYTAKLNCLMHFRIAPGKNYR